MSLNNGELDFKEVAAKYPDVPRIITLKIAAAFHGVTATQRALDRARDEGALYDISKDFKEDKPHYVIGGAQFRDGTTISRGLESVTIRPNPLGRKGDPYSLDVVDGKLWLLDSTGEPLEEVFYVPLPGYYGKKTSRGTPLTRVIGGARGVISINAYGYCYFWQQKTPCQYCGSLQNFLRLGEQLSKENLQDIHEAVSEALQEDGRWVSFAIGVGSDPRGEKPYDNEVNAIVDVARIIQNIFKGTKKRYTLRLISSAVPKEQQLRYRDAGITAIEPHLEVWDKKLFDIICPGKAKYFGRDYWIQSAIDGVGIFGRGNVCTQFVGGAELAQPWGFKTEDEGIASHLEGVEFFAKQGVTASVNILRLAKGSPFFQQKQKHPSLEYTVKLTRGYNELRRKYGLSVDHNDFKRCTVHPDTDLARAFNHETTAEPVLAGV